MTTDNRTTHEQRRDLHRRRADHHAMRASRIIIHHDGNDCPQAQIAGRFYTLSAASYQRLYTLAHSSRMETKTVEILYF